MDYGVPNLYSMVKRLSKKNCKVNSFLFLSSYLIITNSNNEYGALPKFGKLSNGLLNQEKNQY